MWGNIEKAAIRKANMPDGWRVYEVELVKGGAICRGCMTRVKRSGPDKGGLMFTMRDKSTVIVTAEEQQAEENQHEQG